jgi:hypothetical protein
VVLQSPLALKLATAFRALRGSRFLAHGFGLMHLVFEMLLECVQADEIPLAIAAPKLDGVRRRLAMLRQRRGVDERLFTVATIVIANFLWKLADSLFRAGGFLALWGRRAVKVALMVIEAGPRAEGAGALLAVVAMLVFLVLRKCRAIPECMATARRHIAYRGDVD